MGELLETSDATFAKNVLTSATPVLVDFGAEWCQPCRMMTPLLAQLAGEHGDKLRIVKLDVQNNPETPMQYGVMNLPTLLLFVKGEVKERLTGYQPLKKIADTIARYL